MQFMELLGQSTQQPLKKFQASEGKIFVRIPDGQVLYLVKNKFQLIFDKIFVPKKEV